jgi:UDP-N-acetylmuramoyl-tripeptide--D-alanyl-D-alanine ligase
MEAIADAKSEIFSGLLPGGAAILPADNAYFPRLQANAKSAGVGRIVTFGEAPAADIRMLSYRDSEAGGEARVSLFGSPVDLSLGAPGKHQAMNALAVLGAVHLAHAPMEPALAALRGLGAAQGRGARREVCLAPNVAVTLIDESYNANPASMRAALSLLGAAKPRGAGRRIAALGDMLELGPDAPAMHGALVEALGAARVDRLYTAGPLMDHLWRAAPAAMRARAGSSASEVIPAILADLRDGDVIMVKGSNASKISDVVKAIAAAGSGVANQPAAAASKGAA